MIFKCSKYPCYKVVKNNGYIQFSKGEYRTEDKEEIALLKTINDVTFEENKVAKNTKK